VDENPRRNHEEAHLPRSLKSEHSSGIAGQATCTRWQNTKEDGRDMQAKKKRSVQTK